MVHPFVVIFAAIIFGVAPALTWKSNELEARMDPPRPNSSGRLLNPNAAPYRGGSPADDRGGDELSSNALPYQGRFGAIGDNRRDRHGVDGSDGRVYQLFPSGAHDSGHFGGLNAAGGGPGVGHGVQFGGGSGVIHQASGHSGHSGPGIGGGPGAAYELFPSNPQHPFGNQDPVHQAVFGGPAVGGGHERIVHQAHSGPGIGSIHDEAHHAVSLNGHGPPLLSAAHPDPAAGPQSGSGGHRGFGGRGTRGHRGSGGRGYRGRGSGGPPRGFYGPGRGRVAMGPRYYGTPDGISLRGPRHSGS